MSDRRRRAVLVEDERLARVELRLLLEREPGVTVVGEAESVDEAVAVIGRERPDLVFLDIQLGRESGFDLLERSDGDFDVIFVTAYDQHAVRAFEVSAVDYLLKPVHAGRLAEALRKAGEPADWSAAELPPLDAEDRLFVKAGPHWQFLRVDTIKVIESAGDFTNVHTTSGEEILISKPLREWEVRLPARLFSRIHRSTIVNLEWVERVEEWSSQTFQVHVKGRPAPYPMSRRYAARLRQ
jgi:two-component system, LytTR family, response regulator